MVQVSTDRAVIFERSSTVISEARALRSLAAARRASSRLHRAQTGERRGQTIRLLWRARQLHYDRGGRVVAMWTGDDPTPHGRPANLDQLDMVVGKLFEVGLILSAVAGSLDGPARDQVLKAIEEMDGLINEIRRVAFDEQLKGQPGPSDSAQWLSRIRETTAGIDQLLGSELVPPGMVVDLHGASQAAHQAIIAFGTSSGQ